MAVKRDTAEPQRISAMEERGNRRAGERPQIVLCSGRAPRLGPQRTRGQACPSDTPPGAMRKDGTRDSKAWIRPSFLPRPQPGTARRGRPRLDWGRSWPMVSAQERPGAPCSPIPQSCARLA